MKRTSCSKKEKKMRDKFDFFDRIGTGRLGESLGDVMRNKERAEEQNKRDIEREKRDIERGKDVNKYEKTAIRISLASLLIAIISLVVAIIK